MLTSGLKAWVWQRLSAIYLAVFLIWLAAHMWFFPTAGFTGWRAWLAQPVISMAFALFFLSLMVHAWVGVRDVVMDYVHSLVTRVAILTSVLLLLLAMAAWAFLLLAGIDYRTA